MASNPLMNRMPAGRPGAGTDAAYQQLLEHCAALNAGEDRMGSTRRWIVVGQAPNRSVSVAMQRPSAHVADRLDADDMRRVERLKAGLGMKRAA